MKGVSRGSCRQARGGGAATRCGSPNRVGARGTGAALRALRHASFLVALVISGAAGDQVPSHTPPRGWEEARFFQSPFESRYEERLFLESGAEEAAEPMVYSPNRAYWLAGGAGEAWEVVGGDGIRSGTLSADTSLLVFNEREALLAVRVRDRLANYALTARWLNEKLLFVRVWWGRALGTDAIVDVERRQFVYREMLHDGAAPFAPSRSVGALGAASRGEDAAGGRSVELVRLADGVWLHRSHYTYPSGARVPSNGLVVRDGAELTLVDTAWGELATVELLELVAEVIGLPVTRAVVTHSHGDRLAGADVLEARGVAVVAHPRSRRLAIANGLPVPDGTLEGLEEPGSATALGRLEVVFPGAAHAPDNLMIWLPAERLLFGGCAVRAAKADSLGSVAHADLGSWLEVVGDLEDRYGAAATVVPGHGEAGGPELLAHTARLIREARANDEP